MERVRIRVRTGGRGQGGMAGASGRACRCVDVLGLWNEIYVRGVHSTWAASRKQNVRLTRVGHCTSSLSQVDDSRGFTLERPWH